MFFSRLKARAVSPFLSTQEKRKRKQQSDLLEARERLVAKHNKSLADLADHIEKAEYHDAMATMLDGRATRQQSDLRAFDQTHQQQLAELP